MKIIKVQSSVDQPIYSHLDPIVDLLFENGNEPFFSEVRWGSDKEGFVCWLKKPVDQEIIKKKLKLPPTIILALNGDIFCEESNARISHRKNV